MEMSCIHHVPLHLVLKVLGGDNSMVQILTIRVFGRQLPITKQSTFLIKHP